MTDLPPDTEPSPKSVTIDETPDNLARRVGLSGSQVAASALAAVSSAVAASYLGVAGTVIGAGVGSVIATVCTALYQHSLTRTNERIRKVTPATARPRWTRLAVGAAGVFGVALGSIAVFEQVTGGPISSTVRGDDQRGSTLGELVSPDRRDSRTDPATPEPTPGVTRTPTVTPTTPAAAPTPPASAPPVTPTTPPATATPPPSPPPTAAVTPSASSPAS